MDHKLKPSSVIFGCVLAIAVLLPGTGLALVVAVVCVQVIVLLVQILSACLRQKTAHQAGANLSPLFFSVHVAISNEPPALVLATLKALERLAPGAFRFEFIVVDNNTQDPGLWQPVAAYCAARPKRFKFLHFDRLAGAKAGALNVALQHTAPEATHVVTVDADYQVAENFLVVAAAALRECGADYLQFPQAYRHVAAGGAGLSLEFADYFRNYARPSNGAGATLLTGTLSIISRTALSRAGGWQAATLTEDAELGVRLCRNGYRGRFIDQIAGKGLMPFDFPSLQKQRVRWIKGNIQTILQPLLWRRAAIPGRLGGRRRLLVLSQLTAWTQFALVPTAALIAALVRMALAGPDAMTSALAMLSSTSILLAVMASIIRIAMVRRGSTIGLRSTLYAIAARLALAPASARATLDALAGAGGAFEVTPKQVSSAAASSVPGDHLMLFAAGLAGMICALALQLPVAFLASFCLMALLPMALITTGELERYRQHVLRNE